MQPPIKKNAPGFEDIKYENMHKTSARIEVLIYLIRMATEK